MLWKSAGVGGTERSKKIFLEAMMNTEGAERERYANVYFGIIKGLDFCTDSDDE